VIVTGTERERTIGKRDRRPFLHRALRARVQKRRRATGGGVLHNACGSVRYRTGTRYRRGSRGRRRGASRQAHARRISVVNARSCRRGYYCYTQVLFPGRQSRTPLGMFARTFRVDIYIYYSCITHAATTGTRLFDTSFIITDCKPTSRATRSLRAY